RRRTTHRYYAALQRLDASEALYKVQPNAPLGAPHWCNASCRGVASGAIQLVIATGRRLQSKMLVVDPPPGVDPDSPICRRGCFVFPQVAAGFVWLLRLLR